MADGRERVGLLENLPLFGRGIARTRERRELENKLLRDQVAGMDQFTDLLGRTVDRPVTMPGMQVPAVVPENENQIGMQAMQLPGKRYEGVRQAVPEVMTQQGQMEMMQAMSRMGPVAATRLAESLMPGSTQRATAAQKEMAAFGYPMTMEGFQQYQKDRAGPMSPIEAALQMSLLESRRAQEEREAAAAERTEKEEAEEAKTFTNTLQKSADNLISLYGVNQRLSGDDSVAGMLTRPGLPFPAMRRELASVATPEQAAEVDDFNALVNEIAIDRLSTEGFEGNTNARFSAFTDTKPTFEKLGAANAKTIYRNIKGVLLADEAKGYVLPQSKRREYEAFLRRLEGEGVIGLRIGDIEDGHEYLGGVPGDPASWRKVE